MYGIKIKLSEHDDFLRVKETLTRLGKKVKDENTLIQLCYILHKKGEYYILHEKELKILDGEKIDIYPFDLHQRNLIVKLLNEWGLLSICDKNFLKNNEVSEMRDIKIISYKDKNDWFLVSKYNIGVKKW